MFPKTRSNVSKLFALSKLIHEFRATQPCSRRDPRKFMLSLNVCRRKGDCGQTRPREGQRRLPDGHRHGHVDTDVSMDTDTDRDVNMGTDTEKDAVTVTSTDTGTDTEDRHMCGAMGAPGVGGVGGVGGPGRTNTANSKTVRPPLHTDHRKSAPLPSEDLNLRRKTFQVSGSSYRRA